MHSSQKFHHIPLKVLGGNTSQEPINNKQYHRVSQDATANDSIQQCRWGIGYQIPSLMVVPYILGLLIAIAHLLTFQFFDGKYENDPDIPDQAHIMTFATIAATVFSFSIRTTLAAVFTQYFWRLVRLAPLQLGVVETLYILRSNPLLGFQPNVLRHGLLLLAVACQIWLIPIATAFPPSSLTLDSANYVHSDMMDVPTFNPSNMWNGDFKALRDNSLALVNSNPDDGIYPQTPNPDGLWTKPSVSQLAFGTIVNGEVFNGPSPCGGSCSYQMTIDAPYLRCTAKTSPVLNTTSIEEAIYTAHWASGYENGYQPEKGATFRFTNLVSVAAVYQNDEETMLYYKRETFLCVPHRVTYDAFQNYTNNRLTSKATTKSVHPLVDLIDTVQPPAGKSYDEWVHHSQGGDWGPAVTEKVRDANVMTLAVSMLSQLTGKYDSTTFQAGDDEHANDIGRNCWWVYADPDDGIYGYANSTVAHYTPLFIAWNLNLSQGTYKASSLFNLTEGILNEMLLNITLSAIVKYNRWTTRANVTLHDPRQQYHFSRIQRLVVPYFGTLAVVLPFLAAGLWALWTNGVPATDHGFLQILMTTRGSPTVDRLAAGGCLGGEANIPARLKELPVRFGEVVSGSASTTKLNGGSGLRKRKRGLSGSEAGDDRDGSQVRLVPESGGGGGGAAAAAVDDEAESRRPALAGFGTPDEVTGIRRGRSYGVMY
ncbi:hypothetical protein BDW42DRAFT_187225 [Aspergillus taichungensis]|uniref:Uncharacterized protein n=1 Tax=Aspergillus taichungensis TaxID=482145 RepID=A0A2J5HNE9_9EURO|nr:hypothetical protein BDW42DRAFT_187225 [Aspergillus taichungensis]